MFSMCSGGVYCYRIIDWPQGIIILLQLSHLITVSLGLSKVCWFTSLFFVYIMVTGKDDLESNTEMWHH